MCYMSIQNYLFISSTDNYLPEYLLYILVVPIKYDFKEKNIVQKFLAEVPSLEGLFVRVYYIKATKLSYNIYTYCKNVLIDCVMLRKKTNMINCSNVQNNYIYTK
jgi:hypothetical protein